MQIMRYAEKGSIRFLWINAPNPAVSLPELRRIREILAHQNLFLVVQDIFITETAELAEVAPPGCAPWAGARQAAISGAHHDRLRTGRSGGGRHARRTGHSGGVHRRGTQ